jgi:hypothetical protein
MLMKRVTQCVLLAIRSATGRIFTVVTSFREDTSPQDGTKRTSGHNAQHVTSIIREQDQRSPPT